LDRLVAEGFVARALESRHGGVLPPDHVLHVHLNGKPVEATVAQILRDRKRFHNRRAKDPLEPGYQGGATTAKLLLDAKPYPVAVSWAHGQKTWRLARSRAEYDIWRAQE
jgi:hypothetical protein